MGRTGNIFLVVCVLAAGAFAYVQWQMMQLTRSVEGTPCPLVQLEDVGESEDVFSVGPLSGSVPYPPGVSPPMCDSFLAAFRCDAVGPMIVTTGGDNPLSYRISEGETGVLFGRDTSTTCTLVAE